MPKKPTRLDRIRAAMAEERLDALWVSGAVDDVYGRNSQNRFYTSGFTGSAGVALVTRDRALMVVDSRYVEQAKGECPGFETWDYKGRQAEWVPKLVKHAGLPGAKIGVSAADMTLRSYEALQKAIDAMPWGLRPQLGSASPLIEKLRAKKDATEVRALQQAIDIADRAFEAVEAQLKPGLTERGVAGMIEAEIRALGGQGVSFDTIVAAGPHGARPHAEPRDEPIPANQPIVIDMGVLAGGYCSDLTRTTVIGRLPEKMREVYEVVHEAQQAAIDGVKAGMACTAAHDLADAVIKKAGYGEQFGHGLGHGVGLEVHETPYLGTTSEDTLEDGMVFTIEPGIYLPGVGGVRIEDVVVLEKGKARVLSHARKLAPAGV